MWGSFAGPIMAGTICDGTQSYAISMDHVGTAYICNDIGFVPDPPWTTRMAAMSQGPP